MGKSGVTCLDEIQVFLRSQGFPKNLELKRDEDSWRKETRELAKSYDLGDSISGSGNRHGARKCAWLVQGALIISIQLH